MVQSIEVTYSKSPSQYKAVFKPSLFALCRIAWRNEEVRCSFLQIEEEPEEKAESERSLVWFQTNIPPVTLN